jgi:hypothetical protein
MTSSCLSLRSLFNCLLFIFLDHPISNVTWSSIPSPCFTSPHGYHCSTPTIFSNSCSTRCKQGLTPSLVFTTVFLVPRSRLCGKFSPSVSAWMGKVFRWKFWE